MTPPNKSASASVVDLEERLNRDELEYEHLRLRVDNIYGTVRLVSEKQIPELSTKLTKLSEALAEKIETARAESLTTQSIVRNLEKHEITPLRNQVEQIAKDVKAVKPLQTIAMMQGVGTLIVVIVVLLLFVR